MYKTLIFIFITLKSLTLSLRVNLSTDQLFSLNQQNPFKILWKLESCKLINCAEQDWEVWSTSRLGDVISGASSVQMEVDESLLDNPEILSFRAIIYEYRVINGQSRAFQLCYAILSKIQILIPSIYQPLQVIDTNLNSFLQNNQIQPKFSLTAYFDLNQSRNYLLKWPIEMEKRIQLLKSGLDEVDQQSDKSQNSNYQPLSPMKHRDNFRHRPPRPYRVHRPVEQFQPGLQREASSVPTLKPVIDQQSQEQNSRQKRLYENIYDELVGEDVSSALKVRKLDYQQDDYSSDSIDLGRLLDEHYIGKFFE